MATVLAQRGMVRWATGADSAATNQVIKTRNFSAKLTPQTAEDTGHGDVVLSKIPTFLDFTVTVTALFDSSATAGAAKSIITDALAKTSGRFYLYPDSTVTSNYWSGRGYIALDTHDAPYNDFSHFNFTVIPAGGAIGYQG